MCSYLNGSRLSDGRMVKALSDSKTRKKHGLPFQPVCGHGIGMKVPDGSDMVYKNLDKFLRELGGSLDDIVLSMYMKDIKIHWLAHERLAVISLRIGPRLSQVLRLQI